MFEFKTRTETINGCRFYEQDLLLFDYSYRNDTVVECAVDYQVPGFGFVVLEENEAGSEYSENVYIIKLGTRNKYQIINKQFLEQTTLKDEYINAGIDIDTGMTNLRLVFKFIEDSKIRIYYVEKDEYGINQETLIIEYMLPHTLEKYKLGFYSNGGNTLKFASIDSETPSNWISNIFNGNGGRINWIKNGFTIENCEYDCEVESQNIQLKAGTYYFDFKTTNPDIKYYIYKSSLKDTDTKRPVSEIMATKEDEVKNILDYENGRFILEEDGAINIKFKGKYGTITEIAIKKNKSDSFVETDYDNIKREASYIKIDLNKIVSFEIEGTITEIPENDLSQPRRYDVFLLGSTSLGLNETGIELNVLNNFKFNVEDGLLYVNEEPNDLLKKALEKNKDLYIFKNVTGTISKFIITLSTGDVIDVLLQKTFKATVNKDITTPIIVTDINYEPFDLSSSYREVVIPETVLELFNKYNQIKLTRQMCLNNANVRICGIKNNISIDLNKDSIEEAVSEYEMISPNKYKIDYKNNTIKVDADIRNEFKYVLVEYDHCENYRYEFTNYEREIFELKEIQNLYIENRICDVVGAVTVYGVKAGVFLPKHIYKIPSNKAVNSIDYCVSLYDVLLNDQYSISETGKVSLNTEVWEKYDYLIIDYLKDRSYTVNEREKYYELDISTSEEMCKIIYDYNEENIVNTYKVLNLNDIVEDNFIVLRKRENQI